MSLPIQTVIGTTVPGNGDINPYGITVVPRTVGHLVKGDVLISNFNASSNLQGTGTTIVQIAPNGTLSLFATVMSADVPSCPGGVGLSTALVVQRDGWVVVGSLPTVDGTSATAKAGYLIVLDRWGHVAETVQGGSINGPWDMTALDRGDSAIAVIPDAVDRTSPSHKGKTVSDNHHLNQPLGLAIAPNGDILTVNAGDGNAVETTPGGHQVVTRLLDAAGGGTLFGLAVAPGGHGLYFVDDGSNNLQLLH